jgi:hypothetical protein
LRPAGLVGSHIKLLITSDSKRKAISQQLSLGGRDDGEDDPGYDANTQHRQALRALLLCQRVYFAEDTWSKQSLPYGNSETIGIEAAHVLDLTWKTDSLRFWRTKTEAEIQEGIKIFEVDAGARAIDVQQAAFTSRPNQHQLPGNLELSRRDTDTVGFGVVCYVGVQGWLVRSGVVSMRWLHQNCAPNGKKGCDHIFGEGNLVWDAPITAADHQKVRNICRSVSAGHIVHIWSPANTNWNGHWIIANGDGTACGVNNGEFTAEHAEKRHAVQKGYTKTTTIFEQFVHYSNEWTDDKQKTQRTRACMAVIDPMRMPNRM